MTHVAAVVILTLCCIAGLLLIPLGLPGLWIMVGGVLAYGALTQFQHVSITVMAVVLGLAFLGEIVEWWVGFGLAKRYGGSRRAGWGALVGGMVGAVVGVPLPVIGSVIGALIGAFAGAALFEYTVSQAATTAVRAGWGAVLGRVAAAAAKIGFGVVIAVIAVVLVASCGGGSAPRTSATPPQVRHDERISAGGAPPATFAARNPYTGDKRSADEGARIFTAMNCDGCHGGGGTGWVGPSLADGRWRFGGSDGAIFESIYYGRPHGMPAYGGLLLQREAVWKLVTYLESLERPADVPTESWP